MKFDELIYRCRNCKKEFAALAYPYGQGISNIRENQIAIHLYCNNKLHTGIGDIIRIESHDK